MRTMNITSNDLAIGAVRVESLDDLPAEPFLIAGLVPCPVGAVAKGGVGGQMFTACRYCGFVSPSTATRYHDTSMVLLLVAEVVPPGSPLGAALLISRLDFDHEPHVELLRSTT